MDNLRPQKLGDIIGQSRVVQKLKIAISAAQKNNRILRHVLLSGGPGLGKTTLSLVVANELQTEVQIANGANLQQIKQILPYLIKIKENSILFIDEIHRISTEVMEFMYPAIEDFQLNLVQGNTTRTIKLSPFTLIGATTSAGSLTQSLQDRFPLHLYLDFYSLQELTEIIAINAEKLRTNISDDGLQYLAEISRGTPRIANNYLLWILDYAIYHDSLGSNLQVSLIQKAMNLYGVSKKGLTVNDIYYLNVLRKNFNGGPVGLPTLAAATNFCQKTIMNNIEPYLLRRGLIEKTPRGRILRQTN